MSTIEVTPKIVPPLDPGFVPAVLWNRAFRKQVSESGAAQPLVIELEQREDSVAVARLEILPGDHSSAALNNTYIERIVKFLLWQKGGWKLSVAGSPAMAEMLAKTYCTGGARQFDSDLIGMKVYGKPLTVETVADAASLQEVTSSVALGRHLDGCRIGFDLGGSDRKCAAVMDGKCLHSEEVKWDPYFEKDPAYHLAGIRDSLKRAADKLPRVDAIGGSAAGIYVDNEVRVASLFRGLPEDLFKEKVVRMFLDLKKEWGIPFQVINDGEVTALAGSMAEDVNAVLGVAMGTSEAAGYVTPGGGVTTWLNELAFAPVDYRVHAPMDEWSGDVGCGVQYFSQQAVARLCGPAGIDLPDEMPFAEKLIQVQDLMQADDDPRAAKIYETIGVYLGYGIAHYADFYAIENILLLGRVLSGKGGEIIQARAAEVLAAEFPELHKAIIFRTPDEKQKRYGQATAAASLPPLGVS